MRNTLLSCFIALIAIQVFAAGIGLKPGLWETQIVKQVSDGKDMTTQLTGAMEQMQQRLASLPPEQREKIEAMMKDRGGAPTVGNNGAIQMCITAEMAKEDKPIVNREGCEPATINRSGNHSTFEFSCTRNGNTTTGKGESNTTGDLISTVMDMTVRKANGESHVMHTETQMKFLGADCGDVKPMSMPKASS